MSTETIPTPRTDAAKFASDLRIPHDVVSADFARALERELFVAEEALRKVATDSEAETGWGPDVTTLGYIKQAIRRLESMRKEAR